MVSHLKNLSIERWTLRIQELLNRPMVGKNVEVNAWSRLHKILLEPYKISAPSIAMRLQVRRSAVEPILTTLGEEKHHLVGCIAPWRPSVEQY